MATNTKTIQDDAKYKILKGKMLTKDHVDGIMRYFCTRKRKWIVKNFAGYSESDTKQHIIVKAALLRAESEESDSKLWIQCVEIFLNTTQNLNQDVKV